MQEIVLLPTPLRRMQHCNSNNHSDVAPYWVEVQGEVVQEGEEDVTCTYTLTLDPLWEATLLPAARTALHANLPPGGSVLLEFVPIPHAAQHGTQYTPPQGTPAAADKLQQRILNIVYAAFTHQFDQHNWDTRLLACHVLTESELTLLHRVSEKRLSGDDTDDADEDAQLESLMHALQGVTAPLFPDFIPEKGAVSEKEVETQEEYDILDFCTPAPQVVLKPTQQRSVEGDLFMKLSCTSGKNDAGFERDTSFAPSRPWEMLRRLVANRELHNAYDRCLRYNRMWEIAVCFVRWETRIREDNEFRVFVSDRQVTAVAQQKWYKRLAFRHDLNAMVQSIISGCATWQTSGLVPYDSVMLDVWIDDNLEAHLIECNPWGPAFSSGSSLFHWIGDAPLIHNKENKVYVRYVGE